MSRKLNLHLPTYSECILHRSISDTVTNESITRDFKSSTSLKLLRESLNKTSEKIQEIQTSNHHSSDSLPLSKTPAEMLQEIDFLKAKIQKLEDEK